MRLSVMPANGGSPQVLSDITGPVFPSDWSSDGKLIAYTGFSPTPQIHVGRISGKTFEEVWSYKVPYRSTGVLSFFRIHFIGHLNGSPILRTNRDEMRCMSKASRRQN